MTINHKSLIYERISTTDLNTNNKASNIYIFFNFSTKYNIEMTKSYPLFQRAYICSRQSQKGILGGVMIAFMTYYHMSL